MLRHCILVLLVAPLLALPAHAEEITLTVHGDTAAGTLPTYFEPSAFFGWTSIPMKQDFAVDAGVSHGLIVESTQLLLGPSTSLADYQARLEQSGLATEAALTAQAGASVPAAGARHAAVDLEVLGHQHAAGLRGGVAHLPDRRPGPGQVGRLGGGDRRHGDVLQRHPRAHQRLVPVLGGAGLPRASGPTPRPTSSRPGVTSSRGRAAPIPRRASAVQSRRAAPRASSPANPGAVMQAFIEFSAAQGIQPDFISYHLFGSAPEQNRRANRQVLDLLSANGFAPLPIIVGSWNPLDACYEPNQQRDDPSWPSPPSALGCWQTDNEMGASYSLAFMAHLADGRGGRLPGDVPARRRRLGRERGVPARLGAAHQQEQARPPEGHLSRPDHRRPHAAHARVRQRGARQRSRRVLPARVRAGGRRGRPPRACSCGAT